MIESLGLGGYWKETLEGVRVTWEVIGVDLGELLMIEFDHLGVKREIWWVLGIPGSSL